MRASLGETGVAHTPNHDTLPVQDQVAPVLSVSILVYNHGRYLVDTLESVISQETCFPFEVVVGEDCSSDNSREILCDYERLHKSLFKVKYNSKNVGMLQNASETLSRCRGKYIALLDGDDYWICRNKLERQVRCLERNPHFAMCFHDAAFVDERGAVIQYFPEESLRRDCNLVDLLKEGNFIATSSAVVRGEFVRGLPQSWFGSPCIGDWPLYLSCATHGKVGYIPGCMSAYRYQSETSIYSRMHWRDRYRETIRAYGAAMGRLGIENKPMIQRRVCYHYNMMVLDSLRRRRLLSAVWSLLSSLMHGNRLRFVILDNADALRCMMGGRRFRVMLEKVIRWSASE